MNRWGIAVVACVVAATITALSIGVVAVVDSSTGEEATSEGTMGEELGTFMQQSTAEANGDVDRGMFEASFDRSSDKATAVTNRTSALEARYERIRERMNALENESDLPERARQAQLTRLAVELDSLNESIGDTERRAHTVGVDPTRLQTLRGNASTLTGPEVAAIARNMSGVDPPGLAGDGPPGRDGGGPPTEKPDKGGDGGPPDEGDRGPTDGGDGDDSDDGERGPPDDGDRGPPDEGDDGSAGDDETGAGDEQTDSSTDADGETAT